MACQLDAEAIALTVHQQMLHAPAISTEPSTMSIHPCCMMPTRVACLCTS